MRRRRIRRCRYLCTQEAPVRWRSGNCSAAVQRCRKCCRQLLHRGCQGEALRSYAQLVALQALPYLSKKRISERRSGLAACRRLNRTQLVLGCCSLQFFIALSSPFSSEAAGHGPGASALGRLRLLRLRVKPLCSRKRGSTAPQKRFAFPAEGDWGGDTRRRSSETVFHHGSPRRSGRRRSGNPFLRKTGQST